MTHSFPTRRSSDLFHEDFEDAAGFDWTVPAPRFDWAALIANKDREIDRLEGIYETLLANACVKALHGHARLLDPHTVEIGAQRLTAPTLPVPTGGRTTIPPPPASGPGIPPTQALHLTPLPNPAMG